MTTSSHAPKPSAGLRQLPFEFRHTKVIFTVGPATESPEMLEEMIRHGADVIRLNMAHATHEWTRAVIHRVRTVGHKLGRHISIMMDIKGPEIRTGDVPAPFALEKGERFRLFLDPTRVADMTPGQRGVAVNYPGLGKDLKVGDNILVDNGLIRLLCTEITPTEVIGEVVIPGPMKNRRHINLPGIKVSLPPLTQKDMADLEVAIDEQIEWVALSFVREADHLLLLRDHLKRRRSTALIMAKIEDQSAIENLDDIIRACDALMVARGDLGIEIPLERLPLVQREAVRACLRHGKPVVIATNMLESMISAPVPTRAEITDVANAVYELADAVMLSGETTTGQYPLECVKVLNRIIAAVENDRSTRLNETLHLRSPKAKACKAAATFALDLNCAGIIVFTSSGFRMHSLAALRPHRVMLFAFTEKAHVYRQLQLYWGVEPFLISFDTEDPEVTVQNAISKLAQTGYVRVGDQLVVMTSVIAHGASVDTIQLRLVEHGAADRAR